MPKGHPGEPISESHKAAIRNAYQDVRELRAEKIEQAEPEAVQIAVAEAIRERRMPTSVYSDIVRLMPSGDDE